MQHMCHYEQGGKCNYLIIDGRYNLHKNYSKAKASIVDGKLSSGSLKQVWHGIRISWLFAQLNICKTEKLL